MLGTIATVLTGLVAAGVIFMGTGPFWAPQGSAGFGIPDTPSGDPPFQAWLRVKGVRDIGLGILILVVLIGGTTHLLGWILLAACFVPVGDMAIVLRAKGPRATAFGVHGATAAAMAVISLLLLLA